MTRDPDGDSEYVVKHECDHSLLHRFLSSEHSRDQGVQFHIHIGLPLSGVGGYYYVCMLHERAHLPDGFVQWQGGDVYVPREIVGSRWMPMFVDLTDRARWVSARVRLRPAGQCLAFRRHTDIHISINYGDNGGFGTPFYFDYRQGRGVLVARVISQPEASRDDPWAVDWWPSVDFEPLDVVTSVRFREIEGKKHSFTCRPPGFEFYQTLTTTTVEDMTICGAADLLTFPGVKKPGFYTIELPPQPSSPSWPFTSRPQLVSASSKGESGVGLFFIDSDGRAWPDRGGAR